MGYATAQRQAFSDALLEVGADAPTLCEGWSAYDLASHCWVRERSIKALIGIGSQRFAHLAEREMGDARERHGFVELASLLREGPRLLATLLPGGDDLFNALEYYVHTEDVRRANGLPRRPLDPDFEDMVWKRLRQLGRSFFAKVPVGVLLERTDADEPPMRVRSGAATVTLLGRPTELLLFTFGRKDAADVRLIGDPESVDAVQRADLGA